MTSMRPIFSYTIVIAIIVCVFGFLIAAVGKGVSSREHKITELEQTLKHEEQELSLSQERLQISTGMLGEHMLFTMYMIGDEPTDEQLSALGITNHVAWRQGVALGFKASTTGFLEDEVVLPLPESDEGFETASLGYLAGTLQGCVHKQTQDCDDSRRRLHDTFYPHAQSIVQGKVTDTGRGEPMSTGAEIKCPEDYNSQDEKMESLKIWLIDFRLANPDATLEELSIMRDQFLRDNNCQETLQYIQENATQAE